MRVVIIGAGLGGLCLAHGLRQAGTAVTVHERNDLRQAHPASYGIHLNTDGLGALHDCLPSANWQQFTATTVPAANVINFHDAAGGLLCALDHRTVESAEDPVTRRRAVSRGNLHQALLAGLDSAVVHWGSRFTEYTHAPDGRVIVHFADGTITTCDLLVGADGSNSRVRTQVLPYLRRQDLGILNVAGRVPLTPELAGLLPAQLSDTSINNVVPAGPGWLFASTWATGDSGSRSIRGAENTDRYIVWAWAARRNTYPGGGDQLAGSDLKAHVQRQIRTWAAPFRDLIDATDPTDIGPVPLRTMPQLPAWEPSNVTLIGDAIHNMTPMGGLGANIALRDADTLRAALIEHGDPTKAVSHYETQMREYANAALALSTRNAERATNPARLPRSIFRTLLRAASRSDTIKRRIFHTPAR